MADNWFYSKAGNRYGPVTIQTLKGLIASGQVMPGDNVWRDGMSNWAPVMSLPEFGGSPLPPPMPVSYVPPAPAVPMAQRAEPWTRTQKTFRIMLIVAAGIAMVTFFTPQFIRLSSNTQVMDPMTGQPVMMDLGAANQIPRLAWGWSTWFGITIFIISWFALAGAIVDLCLRKVKMVPAIMQWIHLGLFSLMALMSLVGTILGIFGIGLFGGYFYCIPVTAFLSLLALALGVTLSILLVTKHRSRV